MSLAFLWHFPVAILASPVISPHLSMRCAAKQAKGMPVRSKGRRLYQV